MIPSTPDFKNLPLRNEGISQLAKGIGTSTGASPSATAPAASGQAKAPSRGGKPRWEGANFVVTAESAKKTKNTLVAVFSVTNTSSKEISFIYLGNPSQWTLIDEEGETWRAKRWASIEQAVVGGKKRVEFEFVTEGPGTGSTFSLKGGISDGSGRVPMEYIDLSDIHLTGK